MAWNKSDFHDLVEAIAQPMLRRVLLGVFMVLTAVLVYSATQLRVDAGFNKMVPLKHDYMPRSPSTRRPSAAPIACSSPCVSRARTATSTPPSSCAS